MARARGLLITIGLFLATALLGAHAQEPLPRVVSLDYCADQYVLSVAAREQILALSSEATHIHSFYRDEARGLRQVRPNAEAVLALKPDLVVRNWGGDQRLLELLDRTGVQVVTADYGDSADVMLGNFHKISQAMGRQSRGVEIGTEIRRRLETMKDMPGLGLTAAYVAPGGITAGPGTFVEDIIVNAGFETSSSKLGMHGWQPLPLEQFVIDPPDIIIATFFDLSQATGSNWSITRHARVREMMLDIPVIEVPGRYFSCNGLFQAETVAFLRRSAEALLKEVGKGGS